MWLVDMARGQSREHHGLDLWVCPSHATLARLLGTSERTVRRHIARLVREGWLRRVGRCAPGRAQTYELCVPSWITQEEIDAAQSASPGMLDRLTGYSPQDSIGDLRSPTNTGRFRAERRAKPRQSQDTLPVRLLSIKGT